MAKLSIVRYNAKLSDGSFRVYLRFFHNGKTIYRTTKFLCREKDFNKNGIITNMGIISQVYGAMLSAYERRLEKLKNECDIDGMTAKHLLSLLETGESVDDVKDIDFIDFARRHAQNAMEDGRIKSSISYTTVINSLCDFSKRQFLPVSMITIDFINNFVTYLQKPHTMERLNHGRMVKVEKKGLGNQGINNRIKDFRTIYNEMKRKYSDPLTGEDKIKAYPFKFWKPKVVSLQGGYRAVEKENIRKMWVAEGLSDMQSFARDIFILSFMLMGINATDLYDLEFDSYSAGRINYNRNKTKNGRSDEAFISVEVLPIAKEIMRKYAGNRFLLLFRDKYRTLANFERAVNKGLSSLCVELGIPKCTYYSARHSWATIARNDCGISKEDVDECLNHVSASLKMADKYIKRDFGRNDANNRKVVEYVFNRI